MKNCKECLLTVDVCSGEEMGLVAHVHTFVFVKGVGAATKLKSHCPTCPVQVSVTRTAPHPLLVSASGSPVSKHHMWCVSGE